MVIKKILEPRDMKTKIMAFSPITSLQIDGKTVEITTDFILGGSKITADGDCRHEIKRHLLLGRKCMTNLDNILKSKDITLPTKVHLNKAMVFPIVMYGCESWTIKKAEHRRTDAFFFFFKLYIIVLVLPNIKMHELMFLNCGVGEDS